MKEKITFLFGSGADTDAYEDLSSGQEFAKDLLQNKFSKEINNITGIDASKFQLIYPTSSKIYIQTITKYEKDAKDIFGEEVVNIFIQYNNQSSSDGETIDYKEQIAPLCREWYNYIKKDDNIEDEHTQSIKKFFLEKAVLFDSLDEKFNSLKDSTLNANAKRVINAYFTVFLLMFKKLYEIQKGFTWNYKNIFDKLKEGCKNKVNEGNYYEILADSKMDCHIITTNYTDLVAEQTKKNDIVYLHGKMTWFEDLRNLTVYDCTDETEYKLCLQHEKAEDGTLNLIPFILIPSGVKPLICKKQICEFSKFINKIEESKYLVVMGYKFNSEDNHVNSIIAQWLREDKNRKMVYFNYDEHEKCEEREEYKVSVDFKSFGWAKDFTVVCYESAIGDEWNAQIIDIRFKGEKGRELFKEALDRLKKDCN